MSTLMINVQIACIAMMCSAPPQDTFVREGSWGELLGRPEVREELGLSPERGDALKERMASLARDRADNDQVTSELESELGEQKFQRLRQLRLQVLDGFALLDEDLATSLGLDEEQRQKLAEALRINEEELRRMRDSIKNIRLTPKQYQAIREPIKRDANRRLLEVLTDAQDERFRQMKGEPFASLEAGQPDSQPNSLRGETDSEPSPNSPFSQGPPGVVRGEPG